MRYSTATGPTITSLEVHPVAGRDSMLLNLSGAHGPFFTRNITVITDSDGRVGLAEVPGGNAISAAIASTADHLVGQPVARYRSLVTELSTLLQKLDRSTRGNQTFDQRVAIHAVTAIESVCSICTGSSSASPCANSSVKGNSGTAFQSWGTCSTWVMLGRRISNICENRRRQAGSASVGKKH